MQQGRGDGSGRTARLKRLSCEGRVNCMKTERQEESDDEDREGKTGSYQKL